jgi:hypothetical protein
VIQNPITPWTLFSLLKKNFTVTFSKPPPRRLGWRPVSINHGWAAGPATVSVNTLTEEGNIRKPSRLISINRDCCYNVIASVNGLIEAVVLSKPPRLININRGSCLMPSASVNVRLIEAVTLCSALTISLFLYYYITII